MFGLMMGLLGGPLLAAGDGEGPREALMTAPSPDATLWHRPGRTQEAIFVGQPDAHPVRLTLAKDRLVDHEARIQLQTDARQLILRAGGEALTLPLRRGRSNELTLDGSDVGRLALNGERRVAERGQWLRLMHYLDDSELVVELEGATYANVEFGGHTWHGAGQDAEGAAPAASAEAEAGRGAGQVAQPTSAGVPVLSREPVAPVAAAEAYETPADLSGVVAHSEPWRLSLDTGVDYRSAYYYRGLGRENEGLIVHPYADTSLRVFESRHDTWYNYLDFRVGLQSSHHWGPYGGETGRKWVELNWYGGAAVGLWDRVELEALYVNRVNIRQFFRDVHQIDFTVRYDDSTPAYDWSLQPYATMSVEYENQSDAGWLSQGLRDSPRTSSGVYMELGVEPRFPLARWLTDEPITLRVPTRVGLSLKDYYEDPSGRDSAFGYFATGVDVNMPLASFPAEGDRRFLLSLDAGVHLLAFGSTVRRFNEAVGVGDRPMEVVGRAGINLNF